MSGMLKKGSSLTLWFACLALVLEPAAVIFLESSLICSIVLGVLSVADFRFFFSVRQNTHGHVAEIEITVPWNNNKKINLNFINPPWEWMWYTSLDTNHCTQGWSACVVSVCKRKAWYYRKKLFKCWCTMFVERHNNIT